MTKTDTHPETKTINGQTAVRVESPYADWPGCIYIPKEVTPQQFDQWWKATNKNERGEGDEFSAPVLMYFEERFFLVAEWNIDGLTDKHLTGKAMDIPSMHLITLANSATVRLINQAQTLPLPPAPLNAGLNGAKGSAKD